MSGQGVGQILVFAAVLIAAAYPLGLYMARVYTDDLFLRRGRLRFLDYNDPQLAEQAPYTREELASEMHVREPDGTWTAGFAAWVRILRVLPRLAWLGRLLGLPPLRWAGPGVYGWVARHRQLLPGAPQPCTTNSCAAKPSTPGRRAS